MNTIEILTYIDADPDICFDLARDIDFHTSSLRKTGEKAVGGVVTGLIGLGETVTFRGRHFGLLREHVSRITLFERPYYFRDEMMKGRFKTFVHDHSFERHNEGTRMKDVINFESPYGLLGKAFDHLVLRRYLRRLIELRNRELKAEAERRSQ